VSLLKATYTDPDGAASLPELAATAVTALALVGDALILAAFYTEVWVRGHAPDYINFGTALAAITGGAATLVGALGAAQRMRDGLMKHDGDQR
jgi:hypothetical protein